VGTVNYQDDWEQIVAASQAELQARHAPVSARGNHWLNAALFLISPLCMLVAFLLPYHVTALVLWVAWGLGGLWAFLVIGAFALSLSVSTEAKEAALSFLLGDLFVFFIFLLKPT